MIPQDPVILAGYINMKLRDGCPSLDDLCAEEGIPREEAEARLAAGGYRYDEALRRVVQQ